ncbi:unnamed protein product [Dovyalis caffra]|uniref:Uncharacterized protein n=1 Tax=Dovyalis caffra TaxID=77055 RepID=A0AAV1SHZ4_9ROSI|nr:unnamed protein product [Dovyalis caffra]
MPNLIDCCFLSVSIFIVAFALSSSPVYCQEFDGYDNNLAARELFSELVYNSFSNFTSVFRQDIAKYFGFCITDEDEDWNMAFNFSEKNTTHSYPTAPRKQTNCNLSSWASGCEPGWACGVAKGQKVDL